MVEELQGVRTSTVAANDQDEDTAPDLLTGLNTGQQAAVTSTDGPVIVVAGPGSGKTRVLTHRIAYLMQEKQVPPDGILAVTFTNKAAREMRSRIQALTGPDATNGLTMGTFHALGVRLLRENPGIVADRIGLLPNFLIYDAADQMETAKRAVVALGQDPKQLAPRRMVSRISAAKSLLMSPSEAAAAAETYDDEVVSRVYAQYQTLLSKANAVDFDDLLGLPIRLFDDAPGVLDRYQQKYRYILVDEYQDTNRVQYVLVSALAGHHGNLFVVGDPDQSIYGWRQADIRNILDFQEEFPNAKRIDLEVNYRSTRRIVAVADRVIRENHQRLDRQLRTENDEGEPVVVRELADGDHEAQFVVSEIRRLMCDSTVNGDDIAVMYRTTAQSRLLEQEFRRQNFPYQVVGGVRFYERREVKDVLAVLRLIHNPQDDLSLERIIDNHPVGRGIGPKALDVVREWATATGAALSDGFVALSTTAVGEESPPLTGAARTAASRLGGALRSLRELAGATTLALLFDAVIEQTGYRSSLNVESEEEMQRWANLLELRSDLERYDTMAPDEALAQYLENTSLVADVDSLPEDGQGQVTLITLHSAKGLEFPIVFIVGTEEGLLPISRAVEAEWDDPLPLEEERRLFYVGITRARHLLYITHAGSRQVYGRYQSGVPSRFLASLPQEAISASSRAISHGKRDRLSDRLREPRTSASGLPGTRKAAPAPAPPLPDYEEGQLVFHAKFGEGRIAEIISRPDDQELVVVFQRHGMKRLMATFARLEVIAE